MQSPSAERVQGRVKVGQACLPIVHSPNPLKVPKKGHPSQGHRLPTISKQVRPQQVQRKDPSHQGTLLNHPLWMMHEVRFKIGVVDHLYSIPPPEQFCT